MTRLITDYFLYRHRAFIGYLLVGLIIVGLLILSVFLIPAGLREAEIASAITSADLSHISFNANSVINLPYHLLQKLSIMFFGFTELSIKLPSLFLGVLSAIGLVLLLARWFKSNIAIATTVVMVASTYFMFIIQDGTPIILFVFLTIWLLLSALFVSRSRYFTTLWKVTMLSLAALMLYVPLGIYLLIALSTAAIIHPHIRFIIKRMSKLRLALAMTFALGLLTPLIYSIILKPQVGLTLLGVPESIPDASNNLIEILKTTFGFYLPATEAIVQPLLPLGTTIILILGIYYLLTVKHTARSYILWVWMPLILPFMILNPQYIHYGFIIATFIVAMGMNFLISHWYKLFPRNPYARIAGLVPLAVIVIGLVVTGMSNYLYSYTYNPAVRTHFRHDLNLVNDTITEQADKSQVTLLVAPEQGSFYAIVARQRGVSFVTDASQIKSGVVIASRPAADTARFGEPTRIVTASNMTDGDRFYIYQIAAP